MAVCHATKFACAPTTARTAESTSPAGLPRRVIQHSATMCKGKVYLDRMRSMGITFVEEWMKYGLRGK